MRKPKRLHKVGMLTVAILLLMTASAVLAQNGSGYELTWWTVDGGGGQLESNGYRLASTVGQPEVGEALTGGGYTVVGGVWPSATATHHVYLPLVGRNF